MDKPSPSDPRQAWFHSLKELAMEALKNVALSAHVSRISHRGTSPYTCYHYTISSPTMCWVVDRRYSECHRLKSTLLRAMRRVRSNVAAHLAPILSFDFPKKHIFADRTKRVVGERKHKLQLFLQCCLQIRTALYVYTVVYEQNPELALKSQCAELIDVLDTFLALPPAQKEDQRHKAMSLLSLLQQNSRHSMSSSWNQTFLDDGDCAICLSELDMMAPIVTLPCGHVYHRECVLPWLAKDYSCPLCRDRLSK